MSVIVVDFETYYAKDFSLSKLTTEEYIRDKRFEVIGVAVMVDEEPVQWFSGTEQETKTWLSQFDWANSAVLAHNMLFDGAILAWRFGIIPGYYFDTLCMARAIHGVDAGGSLAALVERYSLGKKGTEVVDALGKKRLDFTAEDLARYGNYCINDVQLTLALFNRLSARIPVQELDLIDMTLRMFTQPVLEVDNALLQDRLEEVKEEKSKLLRSLMIGLNCTDEEEVRKHISSNKKFAAILQSFNIPVPTKISPATGKETYALAKNDEGFIELREHEDPFIQQLCAVRLGTKSTLEESRIERFIGIGRRNRSRLPIPLKYYGAHTGRWAGSDSVNFQNLPSRDKKKKTLKNSIIAPDGYVVINCDSSQIEARVLAWLAGQDDVVTQFQNKEDVYSVFASKIYGFEVTKENPVERFVGKTCLGVGTRVLTRRGWTPILDVKLTDQLWDGVEWVNHCGVSFMGLKPTILLSGLELTADHEILTDHTKWETAHYVQTHDTAFQSALDLATSSLSGINNTHLQIPVKVGVGNRCVNAVDAGMNTRTLNTILKRVGQRLATIALNAKQAISGGGNTNPFYPMTSTDLDYLIASPPLLLAATPNHVVYTNITENGASKFLKSGGTTGLSFYNIYRRWKDGITLNSKWIGLMLTEIMNRGISVLFPRAQTCQIEDASRILKPVYDILNSGSRNRFTVLTDRGPIIVHNCILGLGYGTGAKKLQHTLKTQPPGALIDDAESERIVSVYRTENNKITALWRECDQALASLMMGIGEPITLGLHDAVWVDSEGLRLPNGLYIRYANLRIENQKTVYDSRKGTVSIWGGSVVENVVQALARIIVAEQMLAMKERYRPVLTVHDAAVVVVPRDEVESAKDYITKIMSTPPAWCPGLPVACEAKWGESYGDC